MHKSPAEIALMQIAADITLAAYRHTAPRIEAGMMPADIGAIMAAATTALRGKSEFELVLLGEASAYPPGERKNIGQGKSGSGNVDYGGVLNINKKTQLLYPLHYLLTVQCVTQQLNNNKSN